MHHVEAFAVSHKRGINQAGYAVAAAYTLYPDVHDYGPAGQREQRREGSGVLADAAPATDVVAGVCGDGEEFFFYCHFGIKFEMSGNLKHPTHSFEYLETRITVTTSPS